MSRIVLICTIALLTSGVCLAQETIAAPDALAPAPAIPAVAAPTAPAHHTTRKAHLRKHKISATHTHRHIKATAKHAHKHVTATAHKHHVRAHARHHAARA